MQENINFIQEVEKTAKLAKIKLTVKKKEQFAREIQAVLDHFQEINNLEIKQAENFDHFALTENQTRLDQVENFPQIDKEKIKKAFPQRKGEYLKVKAVL